jgi:hypothetical protein
MKILNATQVVQKLQRHAETIVRECEKVLGKCDKSRQDIEILKQFEPSNENGDTIEMENALEYLGHLLQRAEKHDKIAEN